MKLAAVSWLGVAGLQDGSADLCDGGRPADLIAITGAPGTGKSRLLLGIVHAKERLAPYGAGPSDAAITGGGDKAAKVMLRWSLSEAEQAEVGLRQALCDSEALFPAIKGLPVANDPALLELLQRYDHEPSTGKLDYVPPGRALPSSATAAGDFVSELRRKRLSSGSEKYAVIKRLVIEAMRRRDPQVQRLRSLFGKLCPGRHLGGVTRDSDIELLSRSGSGALGSCSSSEWEAFAVAATLVFVGLDNSIVLYDTPELHIDGQEAARRLTLLREAFPATQFIVATTSAAVIAASQKTVRLGETT